MAGPKRETIEAVLEDLLVLEGNYNEIEEYKPEFYIPEDEV